MRQQVRSKPALLAPGANISVPDEGHVMDPLNAHHAYQGPGLLVAPEHNTLVDFTPQFLPRHVRFCPAICRDDPFIGLRAIVDDGPDQRKIVFVTAADHGYSALCLTSRSIAQRYAYAGRRVLNEIAHDRPVL